MIRCEDEWTELERAVVHEFNEAIRIASAWAPRNEDASEVLRHVSNAREGFGELVAELERRKG